MSHPDNPWEDERGQTQNQSHNQYQGQSYPNHNPYSTYEDQTQHPGPQGGAQPQGQYAPPDHPPPGQQSRYYQSSLTSHPLDLYQPPTDTSTNPWGSSTTQNPPNQSSHPSQLSEDVPPGLPPRRSATDLALPTGQDRSHQIEVMQSYEAAGRKDEHDQNVELLQREFPNIDGSLIAAIYGDSKSMSATREMLGELDG